MKKAIKVCSILILLAMAPAQAMAEWVPISKSINTGQIQFLAVSVKNPNVILAASSKEVYRSEDTGLSWKRILGIRGTSNQIHCVYLDPVDSKKVYVGTDQGLKASQNAGGKWKNLFQPVESQAKSVLSVTRDPEDANRIWIGSGSGLIALNESTGDFKKVQGLPATPVHSILFNPTGSPRAVVSTEQGLYKSGINLNDWERVSVEIKSEENSEEIKNLEQFDVEELNMPTYFSSLIHLPNSGKFYSATPKGIFESSTDAASWRSLKGQNLPSRSINDVERSSNTFYAATNQGIYQWNPKKETFEDFSAGLDSKEVSSVMYNESGDYLLAATNKGVFKFSHPELLIEPSLFNQSISKEPHVQDILNHFKSEPTILDVQNAAIHYAEVHPEKIEAWRKAASRKALFPSVSFDRSIGTNQNIDLDRGGTNDPDKFIQGPNERSFDWSVGLDWDISDLIWSTDQTSIDVRSRLMAELRDDILNEVTHLYFERRRLQVEMLLSPPRDLPVQLEKEIRLEELTAGIDALTGGYLSRCLRVLQ